ncbi:VIT1/CCC1 transporter family protein [Maribellus maritimus]|uniref:VIT1/CCC1 transporter family protein n=1 Tax=Maribellus maritimus TaxID=2870838 RepID=UPI001EEC3B94|nr:VIT1/CCC1 transporter family protein [Maribellus maritimus]MCG6187936.1 VIT1/CCC1 transporter family protein [Maribellus maritimus]
MKSLTPLVRNQIIKAQRAEITEYYTYKKLAQKAKNKSNRKILSKIADDEKRHYEIWKKYSGREVSPSRWDISKYFWLARIFGLTFGLKLMERGEERAQINYKQIGKEIPEAIQISKEENDHEKELIALIDEDQLKYIGSIVLGLNDALVEILGTLAGLTFALQNNRLVALTGVIAGIAGALSMASSEYLSNKSEGKEDGAVKSAIFTGIAYVFAVIFLVVPYFMLDSPFLSLAWAVLDSVFVVFIFSYYISVANDQSFKKRFLEMIVLSTVVGLISFGLGYLARVIFGIEV